MWPSVAEVVLVLLLAGAGRPGAGALGSVSPTDSASIVFPANQTSSQGGQAAETPMLDALDLLARLRHKERPADETRDYREWMVTAAPVIGAKPSSGVIVGAAGSIAAFRGDPKDTHISSAVLSATFSTKKQTSLSARFGMFTSGDRWRADGDNRLQWSSQDTYGLGTGTTQEDRVNVKYDFLRIYEIGFRRVRPSLFAGIGLHFNDHTDVRPGSGTTDEDFAASPYAEYSSEHGFDLDTQISAGASANLLWDNRDNAINADRGWLASGSVRTFFKDFLGGSSTWQEVCLDLRTYLKVRGDARHKLAFWLFGDLVVGGVAPYLDLPATGMDMYGRSGRGYAEGRYRGERLLYGELEYRGTLMRNGLLGMVAFLNVTTVTNLQTGERLFHTLAPAAGAGLRLLLDKRSKTNLCLDVGVGRGGSHGIYLAIQEAF